MAELVLTPVAYVSSPRSVPDDDDWGAVESTIRFVDGLEASTLRGLDDYSHVEVVFAFHLADPDAPVAPTRHPRGNPDWPEVGIFAQRASGRPNHLGVTTCEVLGVAGRELRVRGLDAVDGTPVVDLKPYLAEFGPRGPVRQPPWSHELMRSYWVRPSGPC